jgi:hypothetical protein
MEEANIQADTDFQKDQENENGEDGDRRVSEANQTQESKLYYKINCYPANIMRMLHKGGIFRTQQ